MTSIESSESGAVVHQEGLKEQQEDATNNNNDEIVAGDDTASSSSHGEEEEEEDDDDDEEDSDDDSDDDDESHDELPMPLLSYTRMFGSLPRRPAATTTDDDDDDDGGNNVSATAAGPLAVPSTCSVMGQINLAHHQQEPRTSASIVSSPAEVVTTSTDSMMLRTPESMSTSRRQLSTATASSSGGASDVLYDPLLVQQPHYVLAMGYSNGTVDLVDSRTGIAIQQQLKLRESTNHPEEAVVDMSMDSTGSYLAAVDTGRLVVIWEFRYTIALGYPPPPPRPSTSNNSDSAPQTPQQQQQQQQTQADEGLFSGFMSALTLGGGGSTHQQQSPTASTAAPAPPQQPAPSTPSPPRATTTTTAATTPETPLGGGNNGTGSSSSSSSSRVPRLATSRVEMSRITFPKSFGVPTCIAIDPTYSKKDKAILIGFLNGRVVLTKRGGIFQRRNDIIIHQSTYNDNSHRGIEAIEWRGSLCAWADATGIRIYDTENSLKVAAIDRPTGARPSLYPTLSSLKPTLRFETSDYLLVAWGDCLMGLSISEHGRPSVTEDMQQQAPQQQQQQQSNVPRRKTVEMSMAWELDCVASGVVPLDSDHVLVLGLVPPCDDDEESDAFDSAMTSSSGNDLELQIIAKEDGSILFSNILPLLREDQPVLNKRVAQAESASDYALLSTFALPRMDDALEAEMMDEEPMMDAFDLQVSLFSPSSQPKKRFVDPHLQWSLNATSFDDSAERNDSSGSHRHQFDDDDDNSVDSDDYGFIFRPLSTSDEDESGGSQGPLATPPMMVIASRYDTVLASMRDIDDAVAHALRSGKSALALQRGLRQRRQLRKFEKNDLVDEYFCSLLRIPTHDDGDNNEEPQRNLLSIRRIQLAAKAMPVLFGGEIPLWERWVAEVEKIPGALFVLSDHLPVRDPKLPKEVYGRVLETMLKEIYDMKATQDSDDEKAKKFVAKAEDMFLKVLTAWGPTQFLQEHIRHCKYDGRSKAVDEVIKDAEFRFARRFTQTSAGYLCFPVSRDDSSNDPPRIRSEGYFDSKRSLFDIDQLIEVVNLYAPLVPGTDSPAADASTGMEVTETNARVALDAMSRLHMMKGQYDTALKCFISLGALHVDRPLSEFELGAVDFSESAGSRPVDKPWRSENGVPYTFLLDIIDNHHLQQCLLDDHFLSNSPSTQVVPIFSLLQLVGFTFMGNFLIEHCVPPQTNERSTNDQERRGTLPLDLVAAQMKRNPKLLHWYLHLVFTRKPEVYVLFPNTAYPPRPVTELHRIHFDLHLEFAGKERDSAVALSGIEAYKKTLPLGGIRIGDAKKALENERAKDEDGFSTSFALELAYILEHYGEETESEAQRILDLYMKGAKSMVLAVSFAQRNIAYSSRLWGLLIEHCLEQESGKKDSKEGKDGSSLFGALLEAAALSGADLAKLVTQIPRGLAVEGLRPRLVAAVADYRLKLKMHEAAREGAKQEMISILRELSHRSRRGARYQTSSAPAPKASGSARIRDEEHHPAEEDNSAPPIMRLSKDLRTIERRDRHKLGVAPPIR